MEAEGAVDSVHATAGAVNEDIIAPLAIIGIGGLLVGGFLPRARQAIWTYTNANVNSVTNLGTADLNPTDTVHVDTSTAVNPTTGVANSNLPTRLQ